LQRAVTLGRDEDRAEGMAPDHETVLLEQCNIDTVNHAESTLARVAASNFTPEYLWGCTLYTSVEPCCMCAGTTYWANIGRVVFGLTEEMLLHATGDHGENPTMHLPAREVFRHGQKSIEVIGPVPEVASEVLAVQQAFWSSR
jgi:tRNA(Arg) A34 adenosine deaminase TadA